MLAWLSGLAACAGGDNGSKESFEGTDAAGPDTTDIAGVDGRCTGVDGLRALPWPGAGLQLLVRTPTGAGEVKVEGPNGTAWTASVAPAPQSTGLTLVVLVPGPDEVSHAARVAAAQAFVAGLPDGERVGAWMAGKAAGQLADLTADRTHVLARIGGTSWEPGQAMTPAQSCDLRRVMAAVDGPYGAIARTVVVVGGAKVAEGAGETGACEQDGGVAGGGSTDHGQPIDPVDVVWLAEGVPAGPGVFGWGGDRTPAEAASEALKYVAARRSSISRVGACPVAGPVGPVTVKVGGGGCTLALPEPISHLAHSTCDPAMAARDDYPYPRRLSMTMTAAERAVYDGLYKAKSKDDFSARMVLGEGDPVEVVAHFRGQTSMDCVRRNYEVDLQGQAARRLAPGVADERFMLISLCNDDHYFRESFAGVLLRRFGLFPLESRFVVLEVDGVNQGVYLLLEHPERTLLREHLSTQAIIRRRLDPDHLAEDVKYPKGEAGEAARARYKELAALLDSTPPEGLPSALSARMDLDGYLKWLGLASFLHCGDYVDEVFFHGTDEAGEAWYFDVIAWDPKDIYTSCHHNGQWALPDEYGLVFCAEADLDRMLAKSAGVYARFVELLEETMRVLPAEVLMAAMEEVQADLWEALADDETAAAMVELVGEEPAAATAAGAKASIRANMDAVLQAAEARRAELTQRVAAWRAAR